MKMHRFVVLVGVLLASSLVWSQNYPLRPIKLIVPFPPAGGTDNLARIFVQHVAQDLGQSVVIDEEVHLVIHPSDLGDCLHGGGVGCLGCLDLLLGQVLLGQETDDIESTSTSPIDGVLRPEGASSPPLECRRRDSPAEAFADGLGVDAPAQDFSFDGIPIDAPCGDLADGDGLLIHLVLLIGMITSFIDLSRDKVFFS